MALREILQSNIAPDVSTCNTLINMFCEEGIIEEANYVPKLIMDKGVVLDIITHAFCWIAIS